MVTDSVDGTDMKEQACMLIEIECRLVISI